MVAVDGGTPALSASALVDITVTRNLRDPQFAQDIVRVSIPDNAPPGTAVASVSARDTDRGVSSTHRVWSVLFIWALGPIQRL